MRLDGLGADPERGADLVVAAALDTRRRTSRSRGVRDGARSGPPANARPPAATRRIASTQLGDRRGLDHEPGGTEAEGRLGVLRVVVGGQDDDGRQVADGRSRRPQAAVRPEPDVQEQDVGRRRRSRPAASRRLERAGDADDLEVRLRPRAAPRSPRRPPGGRRRSPPGSVGPASRASTWVPPAGQRRTSRIAPIASARCCMLSSPKWPPLGAVARIGLDARSRIVDGQRCARARGRL